VIFMSCYGHWDLTVDLGDGDVVELCARYSGVSRETFRICDWCCFSRDEDDEKLEYGKTLAEGTEWK
jgi:hypothetical protein